MNMFDYVRKTRDVFLERDPEHKHEGAQITVRHLKSNLIYAHKQYGMEINLLEPSGTDVDQMNRSLHALQDLGDEVMEKGMLAKDQVCERLGWRIRSQAGHIRAGLVDLGWAELGNVTFRRVTVPAHETQIPARASDAGVMKVGDGHV